MGSRFLQLQVIDLQKQLSNFMKVKEWLTNRLGEDESKKKLSSVVYLFSIGTNDYNSLFLTNSTALASFSHQEYVRMVIGNLSGVVKVSLTNRAFFCFLGIHWHWLITIFTRQYMKMVAENLGFWIWEIWVAFRWWDCLNPRWEVVV